jgi:ABC-type transport system involved in multi-copper enzyme maturation permease subunit
MFNRKYNAFFEMLLVFFREDYRFPVLEIFAFLFVVAILFTGSFNDVSTTDQLVQSYFQRLAFAPFLIFLILIWRNLAFGLGGDFEKGIMQTFLVYPVSRRMILLGRLLSSVGVALLLLVLSQVLALYLLAPRFFLANFSNFAFTYVAYLATPLFITAIVLLVVALTKSSSSALIAGLVLYFGLLIVGGPIATTYATMNNNISLLITAFVLNPALSFQQYYKSGVFYGPGMQDQFLWNPSFYGILPIVVANYAISFAMVVLSFLYFARRLEP